MRFLNSHFIILKLKKWQLLKSASIWTAPDPSTTRIKYTIQLVSQGRKSSMPSKKNPKAHLYHNPVSLKGEKTTCRQLALAGKALER